MTKIFGSIIPKFLSSAQNYTESHRCVSIFRRKKVTEDQLSNYIILKATKDDFHDIMRLKHEEYYTDEPTYHSLGVSHNPFLDEAAMNAMAEGLSLVARCKFNGNIVGASINESTNPWDPDMREKFACSIRCAKVRQLLLFHAHIQRLPDIWNRYHVNKVFQVSHLFVQTNHRKIGIAMKLLKGSREVAADCGFKVFRCDATNYYMAKVCERLKMHLIAELRYCAYLGKNLQPVIVPLYPHDSVKVYAEVNPQSQETTKKL